MALMAVLRRSSRVKASILDFWMKKRINNKPAKAPTMVISRMVKPFLLLILLL